MPALGATNIPYSAVLFENQGRNEAYSVFADVTWIPTDALELTAGVRFLDEYRQSGFFSDIPNSVLTGAPPGEVPRAVAVLLYGPRLAPGRTVTVTVSVPDPPAASVPVASAPE